MPSVTDCCLLPLIPSQLLYLCFLITLSHWFLPSHYPIFSLASPYMSTASTTKTPIINGEMGRRAGQCMLRVYSEPGEQYGKER